MKKLCIIPARGGSKRIPNKNIKSFLGKPIICYSISAAIDSKLFDEIIVSTDSFEIRDLAISMGVSVPFMRSDKNSDDFATTSDVIEEVLDFYKVRNLCFDIVFCLYPTAPFVGPNDINKALDKLVLGGFDSVFPVTKFSYPPQRGLVFEEGRIKMKNPKYLKSRSQDLKSIYHDAGQYYGLNITKFLDSGKLFSSNSHGIIISELECQDIDTIEDWKFAEIKYQILNG